MLNVMLVVFQIMNIVSLSDVSHEKLQQEKINALYNL